MTSLLDSWLIWCLLFSVLSFVSTRERVGTNIGDKCDRRCEGMNMHCNQTLKRCHCPKEYPIQVPQIRHGTNSTFCLQPGKLGDECLHRDVCTFIDANADCTQMDQIARCSCKPEYHRIHEKNGNLRCVPETQLLNSDLATLIGVGVGMTLFCGLTCLVLRIFARARFGPRFRGHHYANAHLPPPITLSTDPAGDGGINSRHSSQRSSTGGSRRQSMLGVPGQRGPGEHHSPSNSHPTRPLPNVVEE